MELLLQRDPILIVDIIVSYSSLVLIHILEDFQWLFSLAVDSLSLLTLGHTHVHHLLGILTHLSRRCWGSYQRGNFVYYQDGDDDDDQAVHVFFPIFIMSVCEGG